jgi:protease IV
MENFLRTKFPEFTWDKRQEWLPWVLLPLVAGILLASALMPQPVVGVIRLEDALHAQSARDLIAQIDYAMEHPDIRAVVLALDSPGGTVVATEAVYLQLERLRARKPVVTAVNGMAASGAYYLASGTDYIYAKPTSQVGNVGVIGYLPPSPFIFEEIISTGPYKLWGSPRDTYLREIEMIKQGFYQAVTLGRGDRLTVGAEVILRGEIWSGIEALGLGVIDALGTESDAVHRSARLAHIWHYETADLRELAGIQTVPQTFFMQTEEGVTLPYPAEPGLYLLFIPPLPAQP